MPQRFDLGVKKLLGFWFFQAYDRMTALLGGAIGASAG
jgi:hypothetical protein